MDGFTFFLYAPYCCVNFFKDELRKKPQPRPYLGADKFFNEGPTKYDYVASTNGFTHTESFPYSKEPPSSVAVSVQRTFPEKEDTIGDESKRPSRRTLVITVICIVAVVIGVAIGIGVGVGLKRGKTTGGPSTVITDTSTTGAALSSQTLSPFTMTPKAIMNDTSLAAVELANGDRRLFFQEASGLIRQVTFSSSSRQWIADPGYVVASDAKNHTPIAAITTPQKGDTLIDGMPVIPAGVAVFYINRNDTLASLQLSQGSWHAPTTLGDFFVNISHHAAAPDSRHLAVAVQGNGTDFNTVLFYDSVDRGIVMLNGTFYNKSYAEATPLTIGTWSWTEVTDNLLASRANTSDVFAPPFATSHTAFGEALFLAKDQSGAHSGNFIMSNFNSISVETSSAILPTNAIQDSIQDSDLLILDQNLSPGLDGLNYFSPYYFWVNGTGLSPETVPLTTMPDAPFPFKRLAGFSPAFGKRFILYHQLNGTAVGEEVYDALVGGWTSETIQISVR
ncbi:MAG: hypothetical protein Q9219_007294 [cf. Caloplaca sp. 3 TL-2023]